MTQQWAQCCHLWPETVTRQDQLLWHANYQDEMTCRRHFLPELTSSSFRTESKINKQKKAIISPCFSELVPWLSLLASATAPLVFWASLRYFKAAGGILQSRAWSRSWTAASCRISICRASRRSSWIWGAESQKRKNVQRWNSLAIWWRAAHWNAPPTVSCENCSHTTELWLKKPQQWELSVCLHVALLLLLLPLHADNWRDNLRQWQLVKRQNDKPQTRHDRIWRGEEARVCVCVFSLTSHKHTRHTHMFAA